MSFLRYDVVEKLTRLRELVEVDTTALLIINLRQKSMQRRVQKLGTP